MNARFKILSKPIFLISLFILLLNDHYLKNAYPSWLTGKLSDFSGLFVLAVFIFAAAGKYLHSRKALLIIHAAIGAGFIIWKTAPVENLFALLNQFISIPLPDRVKDISDLLALGILPLSYIFITKYQPKTAIAFRLPKLSRAITVIVLLISSIAIVATSPGKRYDYNPETTVETSKPLERLLLLFEETMAEQNIEIESQSEIDDTTYLFKLNFINMTDPPTHEYPDHERKFVAFLTLVQSPSKHIVTFERIRGWVTYDRPDDKKLAKFYKKNIIEPFTDKLR